MVETANFAALVFRGDLLNAIVALDFPLAAEHLAARKPNPPTPEQGHGQEDDWNLRVRTALGGQDRDVHTLEVPPPLRTLADLAAGVKTGCPRHESCRSFQCRVAQRIRAWLIARQPD